MDISKLNLEQIKKIIKKAKNILVQSSQKINDKTTRLVFSVDVDNDQLEAVLNPKEKIKKGDLMTAKEFQEILSKNNKIVLDQTKSMIESNNETILSKTQSMIESNNETILSKTQSMIESNIKPINERLDKIEGRLTNLEKDVKVLKLDMIEVKADIKAIKNTPTMKKELGL